MEVDCSEESPLVLISRPTSTNEFKKDLARILKTQYYGEDFTTVHSIIENPNSSWLHITPSTIPFNNH